MKVDAESGLNLMVKPDETNRLGGFLDMKRESRKAGASRKMVVTVGRRDRLLAIMASDAIALEGQGGAALAFTLFAIRRASEAAEIVSITKVFKRDRCTGRTIDSKMVIPADRIGRVVKDISSGMSLALKAVTGCGLRWHRLDLRDIADRTAQVAAIARWGRIGPDEVAWRR